MLDEICKIAAALLRPLAQLSQPRRSLSHHLDALLQLGLQFGDIDLVRDPISVADALHITVFNHLFRTTHYGYARQLQRVRDLACATGAGHETGRLRDYRATSEVLHQSNL